MLSKNLQSGRKAESLVEVIIAIFVVAIGSSVATSLIVTALQSNSFSRDNLVALNLAEEGLEAMRSTRDTNWLKYSFDKTNCWNLLPNKTVCTPPVSASDTIGGNGTQYYVAELDANYVWQLSAESTALDLNNSNLPNSLFKLQVVQRDGTFFSPNLLKQYAEIKSDAQDGKFYRMLQISNVSGDSMDVRSIVQWLEGGRVHQVALDSRLTNYQK